MQKTTQLHSDSHLMQRSQKCLRLEPNHRALGPGVFVLLPSCELQGLCKSARRLRNLCDESWSEPTFSWNFWKFDRPQVQVAQMLLADFTWCSKCGCPFPRVPNRKAHKRGSLSELRSFQVSPRVFGWRGSSSTWARCDERTQRFTSSAWGVGCNNSRVCLHYGHDLGYFGTDLSWWSPSVVHMYPVIAWKWTNYCLWSAG